MDMAASGNSYLAIGRNELPRTLNPAHKFNVLEQRPFRIAADLVENRAANENRLVARPCEREASAKIDTRCNHAKRPRSLSVKSNAKAAAGNVRAVEGLLEACVSILRQACVSMEKDQDVACRGLRARVKLNSSSRRGLDEPYSALLPKPCEGAIAASAVNHDYFVNPAVTFQRFDISRQASTLVQSWNDHGNLHWVLCYFAWPKPQEYFTSPWCMELSGNNHGLQFREVLWAVDIKPWRKKTDLHSRGLEVCKRFFTGLFLAPGNPSQQTARALLQS